MRFRFRVAPRAAQQIREASAWWAEHRPKAPTAFADDIEDAFRLICELPGVGQAVGHSTIPGIRRLVLGRIRYVLYYRVSDEANVVEMLALWHASRGDDPHLT